MSIFGSLLTLISGGVLFADTCKNASIERQGREKAEREGRRVWVDNKGCYRVVGTNEKAYMHGDQLKSLKDGRVIVDYGKRLIDSLNEEEINKAKAEGRRYAKIWYTEFCTGSNETKRYYLTELETGRRYYLDSYKRFGSNEYSYLKYYYKEGKGKIATSIDDWEDERVELTKEQYEEWGGYSTVNAIGAYYS